MRATRFSWCASAMALALGMSLALGSSPAAAQYPEKPIRVIIPFNAGSGSDGLARMLTGMISAERGWNFIIDNKPGANGFIAARDAANAAPDGYTLFYTGTTTHGANSAFFKELPYDPLGDFEAIIRVGVFPLVLVTRPGLAEIDSVDALVERLRTADPMLSYAEGSAGPRVAAERFLHDAGVKATHVPYKSSPQVLNDILGNHVDFTFIDTVVSLAMIDNDTLKPLAITSGQRISRFPDLMTMQEAGFEDFEVQNWSVVFARAGTPQAIVDTLHDAFAQAIRSDEWQAHVDRLGAYADILTPAETTAWVESEIAQYQEVLARAGVVPE